MRLHFVLAVVAACKLASSLPISDDQCGITCESSPCCPGYLCEAIPLDFWIVSMSSFHLTLWLTDVVDRI